MRNGDLPFSLSTRESRRFVSSQKTVLRFIHLRSARALSAVVASSLRVNALYIRYWPHFLRQIGTRFA
jgi:hypothetical protein